MPGARATAVLVASLFLGVASPASSEPEAGDSRVKVEVTVVRVSDQPGAVDPRAARLDRFLRGQVAYQSLELLDTHRKTLSPDSAWKVSLPGRSELRLRPLDIGARGTLLSVGWEGVVQGDFRVRPGSPLIFGGPEHGGGKLVVVVDTR
jgi:hypothetical protein